MNKLQPIEREGFRLLTTAQLADSYGTDAKRIQNNFSENRVRFVEGKHFILLAGQRLMDFKNDSRNSGLVQKQASQLYLWTEKGAWLHAKSLNTDQAWDAYELLVDEYYRIKSESNLIPLDERRVRMELFKQAIEHEQRLDSVEQKILEIDYKVETQITLNSREQRILRKAVQKRGMELAEQVNFRQLTMVRDGIGEDVQKIRSQLFREIYRDLWDRFGVSSYADILKKDLDAALGYVSNWIPRQVA